MKRNASTRLPSEVETPLAATSLDVAYRLALAADQEREREAWLGYRLYWLSATEFGSFDLPLDGSAFAIVGRHEQCDVVLKDDPTIALRHLLVRASPLDGGFACLSVLDLHTDLGFEIAGARAERSIAATGPIVLRVGAYAIVALPGGEPMPTALPDPVCTRVQRGHPYREPGCPAAIALLPRAIELGESQPDPTGPGWTLTVTSSRGAAEVRLSPLDLETGVLVGRAPKCNAELREILHDGVSRVHLLLRRGRAYDLASTQGSYAHRQRVRSVGLDDAGTDIRLGKSDPVALYWRAAVS